MLHFRLSSEVFYFTSIPKVECICADREVLLYSGFLVHNIIFKFVWICCTHTLKKKRRILINILSHFKNYFDLIDKGFYLTKEKREPRLRNEDSKFKT